MKISIIVPIYNIEKYVEKCIKSLINQTYKNIEVLLVDDGSQDSSTEICKKFTKKDCSIKYLRKENGGLSSARNYGLQYATGDYVWFIDGDDYIANDAVEILVRYLKNNENDVLCFNYYEVREKETIERTSQAMYNVNDRIKNYIVSMPSAWSRVYKKSFLDSNKILFKEGIIYEDLAIIPALVCFTEKIGFINDYLYYYVIRENSIMHIKQFKKNKDDKFIALETLVEIFKKTKKLKKYKDEIEYLYIKHLLIMYSTEILIYKKEIYKPRLERVLNVLNENYKYWEKNIYFSKEPFTKKIYVYALKKKIFLIAKIINNIYKIVH